MSSEEVNLLDPAFRLLHLQRPELPQPFPAQRTAAPSNSASPSNIHDLQASSTSPDEPKHPQTPRRKGAVYTKEEDAMIIAFFDAQKRRNRKAKREETYRIGSEVTWRAFEQLHPTRMWSRWQRRWYTLQEQRSVDVTLANASHATSGATESSPKKLQPESEQDSPQRPQRRRQCTETPVYNVVKLTNDSIHGKRLADDDQFRPKRRRKESTGPAQPVVSEVEAPNADPRERAKVNYNLKELSRNTRGTQGTVPAANSINSDATGVKPVEPPTEERQRVHRVTQRLAEREPAHRKMAKRGAKLVAASRSRRKLNTARPAVKPKIDRRTNDIRQDNAAQEINELLVDGPPASKSPKANTRKAPIPDPWETDDSETANVPKVNQELIKYLMPILLRGGVKNPTEALQYHKFKPLISLPKKRNALYNPGRSWTASSNYHQKADIAALLIQITGSDAPTCCMAKCHKRRGPFKGCVMPAATGAHLTYNACANCVYRGNQSLCDLRLRHQPKGGQPVAPEPPATSRTRAAKSGSVPKLMDKSARPTIKGKSTTEPESKSKPEPKDNVTPSVQHEAGVAGGRTTRSHPKSAMEETAQETTAVTSVSRLTRSGAQQKVPEDDEPVQAEAAVPETKDTGPRTREILRMEPWERAPGRVRSQAVAKPENIAFSKSYLASGIEVRLSSETTFRHEIVRAGHMLQFQAENDVLRACSIATAGKLTVKMDGEQPLTIGTHSLFTVRPGVACVVESEVYDDVLLHITSVKVG